MFSIRQAIQRALNSPHNAPLSHWQSHSRLPTRALSYSAPRADLGSSCPATSSTAEEKKSDAVHSPTARKSQKEVTFETAEPRLSLTFTCTVTDCGTRSSHQFTRRSYEKGIVIVECPGCKNRHLIADHLGWFKESTEDGKLRTVEDLMRAKGEIVKRGVLNAGGDIEYAPE